LDAELGLSNVMIRMGELLEDCGVFYFAIILYITAAGYAISIEDIAEKQKHLPEYSQLGGDLFCFVTHT